MDTTIAPSRPKAQSLSPAPAERSLDELAHDLGNALGVIRVYVELLLREAAATDPRAEDLREIAEASKRADATGRRLVASAGKSELPRVVSDLPETSSATRSTSSDLFQAILDATTDYVGGATLDGRLLYVNAACKRLLGVGPDADVRHLGFADVFPPDAIEVVHEQIAAAAAEGHTVFRFETRMRHATEGEVPVETVGIIHYGPDGQPEYVSGIARDIRERKRLEEELKQVLESSRRLAAIIEAMPDYVGIATIDGTSLYVNSAGRALVGKPPVDSEPWNVAGCYAPDTRESLAPMFAAMAAGEAWSGRAEVLHADGHRIPTEHRVFPLMRADGTMEAHAAVIRDITERERGEAALRRARDEAEAANRAKSDFLSRMSHELRTPLNAILGFAQLLDLEIEEPAQREATQDILKAGRHLLGLINEVLDVSSIEAGKLSISPEPVLVSAAVQECLDLVRPMAADREISIETSALPCGRFVRADRQRFNQVLLNLLSNAVKYNVPGGRVTVDCAARGDSLRVSVSDTGPGLSPGQIARLFVPFERLGAESWGIEGTGLGLALSKRLMETMGGSLGVDSTGVPGEGSTFWLLIPSTEGPVERLERLVTETDLDRQHPVGTERTVVYIEDNLPNFKLIERVMAYRPGVRMTAAMQGRLGLDLVRDHLPDLVLLDIHLPDMSGLDVLAELRADERTRATPVVAVSADATPSHIKRALDAGADAYLTKPLDVRAFLATLDRFLHHDEARQ